MPHKIKERERERERQSIYIYYLLYAVRSAHQLILTLWNETQWHIPFVTEKKNERTNITIVENAFTYIR